MRVRDQSCEEWGSYQVPQPGCLDELQVSRDLCGIHDGLAVFRVLSEIGREWYGRFRRAKHKSTWQLIKCPG